MCEKLSFCSSLAFCLKLEDISEDRLTWVIQAQHSDPLSCSAQVDLLDSYDVNNCPVR